MNGLLVTLNFRIDSASNTDVNPGAYSLNDIFDKSKAGTPWATHALGAVQGVSSTVVGASQYTMVTAIVKTIAPDV
ncbi:hypothetical protein [Winogradskyella sp.]|uniref:hypothetical protein n=1 Tax=Winogradskyella sp. TaxID=1883156 RepID=UPI00262C1A5F|nr:hypothetical protein [Winogradskyella sp.]